MREHNVDIIGGDFNMSAFSTVGDVFSDPEFSALPEQKYVGLVIPACGDSVPWTSSIASVLFDNAALGLGPRDQSAHLPVALGPLHLRNTNLPGPSSIMRSEQAQQRRYDRKHNKTERAKKRRS